MDFIETLLIAGVLVYLYQWIRGTFAIQAGIGIILLVLINLGIRVLGFNTIDFILSGILDVGILAVFIIFQPEIRKLLYRLGQNTNLDRFFARPNSDEMIDEVIEAVKVMSKEKILTIFQKDTPLHDGAVIIRNDRIVAASAYLPISQNPNISQSFGTRHRAAVGVSETNNVFVLVVSEETGRISISRNGSLTSGLSIQKLRAEMEEAFGVEKFDEEVGFGASQTELNLK
jgi:diadenylate cyclase